MGDKSGHKNDFYMMAIVIILFYIEHGYTQTIEGNLQIKTGSGVPLKNVTSVEENTIVQLVFTYTVTGEVSNSLFELSVKYLPDDDWIYQVTCLIPFSGATEAGNVSLARGSRRFITTAHMLCEKNTITITRQLNSESPPYFRIEMGIVLTGISVPNTTATVFTYSKPGRLVFERIQPTEGVIPREGEKVEFRCSCTARPPPKLKISYSTGEVYMDDLTHSPPTKDITGHSREKTSVLTWTPRATASMDEEPLTCQIDDHPSKENKTSQLLMRVISNKTVKPPSKLQNWVKVLLIVLGCLAVVAAGITGVWFKFKKGKSKRGKHHHHVGRG